MRAANSLNSVAESTRAVRPLLYRLKMRRPRYSARGLLHQPANSKSLLELEVRSVNAAVVQLHDELPACTSPGWLSFPDVDVLVGYWIVTKTAAACSDHLSKSVELHFLPELRSMPEG